MKLSLEEKNFVKITKIILDILPKYLRKCFVERWNNKYPNMKWKSNSASGEYLYKQMPNNIKTDYTKKVRIDSVKKGNQEDWDTTTLVFVMLYSGLHLIEQCRPQTQRKEPLLISEAIDTIRNIRNVYFAHAKSMSCSNDVFERVMTELKRSV